MKSRLKRVATGLVALIIGATIWLPCLNLFFLLHLAGLREFTSILNGTVGSLALGWNLSAFLAVIYIVAYVAFVVLVPVLILAAQILLAWSRYCKPQPKIELGKGP